MSSTEQTLTTQVTGGWGTTDPDCSGGCSRVSGAEVEVTAKSVKWWSGFEHWEASGITLADPKAETVKFTMPDGPVTLTAVFGGFLSRFRRR